MGRYKERLTSSFVLRTSSLGLAADIPGPDGNKKSHSDDEINGQAEGAVAHGAGELVDKTIAESSEHDGEIIGHIVEAEVRGVVNSICGDEF